MKKLLFIAVFLMLGSAAPVLAQEEPVLTGPIMISDLLDLPNWFGQEYMEYQPERQYLDRIPEFLEDVDVVCVLGTWCSDSRREVPRMIRIFQSKNLPPEKLQLIGVDREKRSPNGEAAQYNVERVPTFIFIRSGKEIGRIVETPLASLEKDMLGIIDPNAGKREVAPPPPPDMNAGDGADHPQDDGGMPRGADDEPGHIDPDAQRNQSDSPKK